MAKGETRWVTLNEGDLASGHAMIVFTQIATLGI